RGANVAPRCRWRFGDHRLRARSPFGHTAQRRIARRARSTLAPRSACPGGRAISRGGPTPTPSTPAGIVAAHDLRKRAPLRPRPTHIKNCGVLRWADGEQRTDVIPLTEFLEVGAPFGGAVVIANSFAASDQVADRLSDRAPIAHLSRHERRRHFIEQLHSAGD